MDLLQLLSRDDLQLLSVVFKDGLTQPEFVEVMQNLIDKKLKEAPRGSDFAVAASRWSSKALKELFQTIDYNQDGTLQYDELTNFAINSALHHTKNQHQRVELQFREFQLVLPPRATSYGSTTVVNGEQFTPMSEQILTGKGHFLNQSAQLKRLFYIRSAKKFVVEGFTRVSLHAADAPDCLSTIDVTGNLLDVTTAHNHSYIVTASDTNVVEVFEQSGLSKQFTRRKALYSDRCVTKFLKADSGLGMLPSWLSGTGDREGLIRYCNMERLHAQLTLLSNNLNSITIQRRKYHTDAISSLHFMNPRVGGESILSAGYDNRLIIHDVETGAIRLEPFHSHQSFIRHVSLSNIHNMGFSIGAETHVCCFHLDHMQHSVITLEDIKDPHAHKLVGVHSVMNTHQVITADAGGMLKLWDVRQLKCIRSFHVPPLEVDAVTVSQRLKHKRAYGLPEAKPMPSGVRNEISISHKCALLHSIEYCDETKKVFAIGKETTVFEYDTSALVPKAHTEPLVAILYNPMDETIISTSASEIKLWNVRSGTCISSLTDIFLNDDGSVRRCKITSISLDHKGGKRVFVGTDNGFVTCVIPATGKAEWTVMVRPLAHVSHMVYSVTRLFVCFADGHIASLNMSDPFMNPKVIYEPGLTILLPSNVDTEQQKAKTIMKRRKSKRRSRMDSVYKVNDRSAGSPGGVDDSDGSKAVFRESIPLKMFLAYAPADKALLVMEFNARTLFSIGSNIASPITTFCFIRESPYVPKDSVMEQLRRPTPPAAGVTPFSDDPLDAKIFARRLPDADTCGLSLFAAGHLNGLVQIYSIHMSAPLSPITTSALYSIDSSNGIAINTLECSQSQYLVAGCDSNEVLVWDVGPLHHAARAFHTGGKSAFQNISLSMASAAIVGGSTAVDNGGAHRGSTKTLGDAMFLSADSHQQPKKSADASLPFSGDVAASLAPPEDVAEGPSFRTRMSAVEEELVNVRNALGTGVIKLDEQPFVSHIIKFAETGVIACCSGELDSIVRIITVDGAEIGVLALGRTEDDITEAINAHRRNIQPVRAAIEGQFLRRARGEHGEELDPLASKAQGGGDGSPRAAAESKGTKSVADGEEPSGSPLAGKAALLQTKPLFNANISPALHPSHAQDQQGGSLAPSKKGKKGGAEPSRAMIENLHNSSTVPSPPPRVDGAVVDVDPEALPYAPYLWDTIFATREWKAHQIFRNNADMGSANNGDDADPFAVASQHRSSLADSTLRAPPELDISLFDRPQKIPDLVIDFNRIHLKHEDEEDEGWGATADLDGVVESQMKKALRKVVKRIRVIQKGIGSKKQSFESDCPSMVRELVDGEIDVELKRLTALKEGLEADIASLLREKARLTTGAFGEATVPPMSFMGTSGTGMPLFAVEGPDSYVSPVNAGSEYSFTSPHSLCSEGSPKGPRYVMDESCRVDFQGDRGELLDVKNGQAPRSDLASLARRKQSIRERDFRSTDVEGGAATSPPGSAGGVDSPSGMTQRHPVAIREHHLCLDQMSNRLAPAGKCIPPSLKKPTLDSVCVLAGVDLGRNANHADSPKSPEKGGAQFYSSRAEDQDRCESPASNLTLDQIISQVRLDASQPNSPTALASAGVRAYSPDQFKSKTDMLAIILADVRPISKATEIAQGSESIQRFVSRTSGPSVMVHGSGELSSRGFVLKKEAEVAEIRQQIVAQRVELNKSSKKPGLPPSQEKDSSDGRAKRKTPADVAKEIRDMVIPPVVPRFEVRKQYGTARSRQFISDEMANVLQVKTAGIRTFSPPDSRSRLPLLPPSSLPRSAR